MLSPLSPFYPLKAGAVFVAVLAIVWTHRARHPFARLGAANQVTLARALLVSLVAGLISEPNTAPVTWAAVTLSTVAAALDGVDGWLARRMKTASAFGARFDLEVDALLIQVLAILAWQHGKAGAWVLASGLLRYVFVAAGWIWPWMRRQLTPTWRGRTICIVQVAGLIVALAPAVNRSLSWYIAAVSLAALTCSFLIDAMWLWWRRNSHPVPPVHPWRPWAILAVAVWFLDASLTFDNIWPTPAVSWSGKLSLEAAALILTMALMVRGRALSRRAIGWISTLWIPLVLARYVAVTTPALYGRDINLYWDLRFIPDVAAMVVRVAPVWLIALVAAAVVVLLLLLHRALGWSFQRVNVAMTCGRERRALAVGACLVFLLFGAERVRTALPETRLVPAPVAQIYLHQIAFVREARNGSKSVPPSPAIASTFARVHGADVFLVFVESYGAISDEPRLAARLAPARRTLDADIRATNRRVVSAYVESPTFGGSSWLAHISLISGIEVRDPDRNALLMTQPRDTLVKAFSRAGFRTIGLMPGLRHQWPEGRFYGFDEIYGADRLAYTGPEFGWFAVPDQFSLARFDVLERDKPPQPRFIFFPTISTHFPFSPTPPYQPDWPRMLTAQPYDGPEIVRAYAGGPDWTDFSPAYAEAMAYDFAVLGGYLRQHADRDLVMILIGDHQPPAAVSGEHATWNVPVHVITSRTAVLDRLEQAGFHAGLTPGGGVLSHMHALLPILLQGFGT